MTEYHVCQYGACEDPPKYKLVLCTIMITAPATHEELLVCDHHLELMRKSVSIRIISEKKLLYNVNNRPHGGMCSITRPKGISRVTC